MPPPYDPVAEGLFGFLLSTWQGLGLGYAQGASYAPPSVQVEGFDKLYAEAGTSPWAADGCPQQFGGTQDVKAQLIPVPRFPSGKGTSKRAKAYRWALRQKGCWYQWAGTGPCGNGYDCSGLVMEAYLHAGIHLPRTTYDMLASPKLIPVSIKEARPGDLAFYGSGHVELVVYVNRWHWTFGAHDSGSRVGFIHYGGSWVPTAIYRVKGAG
jgi:hypothetical protein